MATTPSNKEIVTVGTNTTENANAHSSSTHWLLDLLPRDILQHCIMTLMNSSSLIAFGRCSRMILKLSRQVDLIDISRSCKTQRYAIGKLIRDRWEADTFFASLPQYQQEHLLHKFAKVKVRQKKRQPPTPPEPRSNTKEYQIGRLTDILFDHHIGTKMLKIILSRLHLLTTIKSITIAAQVAVTLFTSFPPHLRRLTFGANFAGPIDAMVLQEGLLELEISSHNVHFDGVAIEQLRLPSSLRLLRLCGSNSTQAQPLDLLVLPTGLRELDVGSCYYNQSVGMLVLPEGLTKLSFGRIVQFDHPSFTQLQLPSTLTELEIGKLSHPTMREWIPPPSLTRLVTQSACQLRGDPIQLPHSLLFYNLPPGWSTTINPAAINFRDFLTHVEMIARDVDFSTVHFPPSVTSIEMAFSYQGDLKEWHPPSNLRDLTLGSQWHRPLTNDILRLPASLTRLRFQCAFAHSMSEFVWPPALECLSFRSFSWNCRRLPRIGSLPLTMKRIELSEATTEWLGYDLPRGCHIYERHASDQVGIYCRVSEARIKKARKDTDKAAENVLSLFD